MITPLTYQNILYITFVKYSIGILYRYTIYGQINQGKGIESKSKLQIIREFSI